MPAFNLTPTPSALGGAESCELTASTRAHPHRAADLRLRKDPPHDLRRFHPDARFSFSVAGSPFHQRGGHLKGIVRALEEYRLIKTQNIRIFVRRAGPQTYQEGLRVMRDVGKSLEIPTVRGLGQRRT